MKHNRTQIILNGVLEGLERRPENLHEDECRYLLRIARAALNADIVGYLLPVPLLEALEDLPEE